MLLYSCLQLNSHVFASIFGNNLTGPNPHLQNHEYTEAVWLRTAQKVSVAATALPTIFLHETQTKNVTPWKIYPFGEIYT